jgi:hypothetical protein
VSGRDLLSPAEIERAWKLSYHTSLDDHADTEVAWEAEWWRRQSVPSIAELCDALLAER